MSETTPPTFTTCDTTCTEACDQCAGNHEKARLGQIAARAARRTDGSWARDGLTSVGRSAATFHRVGPGTRGDVLHAIVLTHKQVDADFIANCPDDIEYLLAAIAERDAPQVCTMTHTPPFDFAQCETHDETFPLGGVCRFQGRHTWEVFADEADEQRQRAVMAEMALDAKDETIAHLTAQLALKAPTTGVSPAYAIRRYGDTITLTVTAGAAAYTCGYHRDDILAALSGRGPALTDLLHEAGFRTFGTERIAALVAGEVEHA